MDAELLEAYSRLIAQEAANIAAANDAARRAARPLSDEEEAERDAARAAARRAELQDSLEKARRALASAREERNLLLDRVYEAEVAGLEVASSGSSSEDDAETRVFPHTERPAAASSAKRPESESEDGDRRDGGGKKRRVVRSAEAAAATPRRTASVPTDAEGRPVLPVTLGVVTVHALGRVVHDRPAFHNKRYIWPVGLHTTRTYLSCVDASAPSATYHSRILDGGAAGPVFEVALDAADVPAALGPGTQTVFSGATPTGAWTLAMRQAAAIRGGEYKSSASGPEFFGLANPTVSMLIEGLPGAEHCAEYQRKAYTRPADDD